MNIISYTLESYSLTDPDTGAPLPAFVTKGCGCCSSAIPVTQENIDKAIQEAEEWLETLRSLTPYNYPPEA